MILKALDVPSETRPVLAEFMALRAVLLMLHTDLLQGLEVTRERIATALQQSDAKKYAMADIRIRAFLSGANSDGGDPAK